MPQQYEGTSQYVTQNSWGGERAVVLNFQAGKIHSHCGTTQGIDSEQYPLQASKAKTLSQKLAQTTFPNSKRSYKSLHKLSYKIRWKKSKAVSLALGTNRFCIAHFL